MGIALKPRIVLSGVNFVEAGPLSLFTDALQGAVRSFGDRYTVTALVHRRNLFNVEGVEYLEFPQVKSSWLRRLYFEYVQCLPLSRSLRAKLWLAMHDITPRVRAGVLATYCHNPAPFYRFRFAEARRDPRFAAFQLLYSLLYGLRIQSNDFVIVQQAWLREQFRARYRVDRVIVAHPALPLTNPAEHAVQAPQPGVFFYPALPRSFKNIETILRAAARLEADATTPPFAVWLTVRGDENSYAAGLREQFGHLRSVQWLSRLSRREVAERYAAASCLLFPSRLETWGMPITEWQCTGRPMLVADLPYAHETVGEYDLCSFFPVDDAGELSRRMAQLLRGELTFTPARVPHVDAPFAPDWKTLFAMLLKESPADALDQGIGAANEEAAACFR